MKITGLECVVFDVETTGFSPKDGDRIIEIAAIKTKNGKTIDTFDFLINPERPIPPQASQVNNITDDMVSDAPKADAVLPQMIDFIGGAVVVGHNVKFDLEFLCFQLAAIGRKLDSRTPTLDTLKMARALIPQLSSYRLENVAQYFGAKIEETHRALVDVELTVTALNRMLHMSELQGINTCEELFKQFGVEKPKYEIEQTNQGMLF